MANEPVQLQPDLIYDVGMHKGEDTEFYLTSGFRVLAIDADPDLTGQARLRFAPEIESGRLTILNVGISQSDSVEKFWICEANNDRNSFIESFAGRDGCAHHSIDVPTRRFDDILRQFGIPIYLKIDIEGRDRLCIDALQQITTPRFISAEDGGPDPRTGVPGTLASMRAVGYRYFNLVSQRDFRPLFRRWHRRYLPNPLVRVVNSAAYGRLRLPLVSRLVEPITYRKILARRNGGHEFKWGSSGPWGKGIPGGWVTFEEACRLYTRIRNQYLSDSSGSPLSFWCDWHATTETPPAK
jgi:FkbM family methyltransferase